MRIKNVFNYKKPKFWIVLFSVIIVAAVGIGLATNHGSTASINGQSYRVKEIIYEAGMYSFTYAMDTAPQFSISSDYSLYSKQVTEEDWDQEGVLYPYEISRQELDTLFVPPSVSSNNFHKARSGKVDLSADKNDDIKTFYLVIQLRAGRYCWQ